jgi:hypothetical protein
MNARRGVALDVCAVALVAGCAGGAVTTGSTPAPWPSANMATATYGPSPSGATMVCATSAPEPTVRARTDLPDDPLRADLLWFPGMNAGVPGDDAAACRTWHTSIDASTAKALVADLKALPGRPGPTGASFSCGDNGSFVQVWLTTSQGSPSFRINLLCSFDFPSNPEHLGTWPTGMPRHHV